jgi:hypothetical protein
VSCSEIVTKLRKRNKRGSSYYMMKGMYIQSRCLYVCAKT